MIETEVHQRLRAYLREQGQHTQWPHHLTMARLVARALRVGRSALIQIDALAAYQGSHRLSYLIPALLWPGPAVLALPDYLLKTVLQQDIPDLQQALPIIKSVRVGNRWPEDDFRGLLITSAQSWVRTQLQHYTNQGRPKLPCNIPTLIDGAHDLERWVQDALSIRLSAQDWDALMLAFPSQQDFIRDRRVRITHAIFQHPANPYSCHLIEDPEKTLLNKLYEQLTLHSDHGQMPLRWQAFWERFQSDPAERLAWSQLDRTMGSLSLCSGPTDINAALTPVWEKQPVVLIGTALDESDRAERYRERLGLGDLTCLKFGPDRRNDLLQLYLPDKLPMPNTSQFKAAALQEIRRLLNAQGIVSSPTVIIVGDVPLKAQFAAILAAEFGSRVRLEAPIESQGILITGWEYWQSQQQLQLQKALLPGLMIIPTLPIPSLENPLVAGRVAAYKRRRQDWFKAYLLPAALSRLQSAIAPLRARQLVCCRLQPAQNLSLVALLDNRVNHRSYGTQVLDALSPIARSSYLNLDWFTDSSNISMEDTPLEDHASLDPQ